MKINKVLHPILGIIVGTILFLAGISVVSVLFVAAYKSVRYAGPFVSDLFYGIISHISRCLPS